MWIYRRLVTYRVFLTVALSLLGVFVLAEMFTASRIAHAQGSVTPFTLKLENRLFTDGQAPQLMEVTTRALRSDGARMEMGHVGGVLGIRAAMTARRVTLPNGEYFTVHDSVRAVASWNTQPSKFRDEMKTKLFSMNPDCTGPNEERLGTETIMGQETVVVLWPSVSTQKIMDWRAINLNCTPIKSRVEKRQTDGTYKVSTEITPASLVLGEPDPALFDIPSDYTELKPSEIMHKETEKMGLPWNSHFEAEAQRDDGQYAKLH